MLDTTTKHRIDAARDILVGKVPDPKSQVEQITIALIYKFMDDMDAASEELGGKRKFFTDDFARYGWAKLMHAGLGGHETLNLYAEAITRMPENPGIPPLFRDIFKNAFLPYRNPETLKGFLKIIDQFEYDHSERLGDAFEYLLSVLGSQGAAGQFRTPRHIIDFIVSIIDPKKDETILDPACGTAGFLISPYKHILKNNTDEHGHNTLTPDERGRLVTNLKGYDISPDMVRLSLVNLYLHGFVDPHVFEYDTLTSEDRWNQYADVILANPPFMSPTGGTRPHKRFSVNSRRSEVLFVDYIAEHLTPSGRAGIIVPEGIIFQSQNAYKQLRKLLVEEYLIAVISLPAGVFQPYSGVKTSVLILDKALAKKTDSIAFFKVENDGFDLGAQRRVIDKNDLPQVQAEITDYLGKLRASESVPTARVAEPEAQYATDEPAMKRRVAEKTKIAADGEYNLNSERYRENPTVQSDWPMVALGDIILGKPQYGSGAKKVKYNGEVRYVRITDITDSGEIKPDDVVSPSVIEQDRFLEADDLLVARSGSVGRTYIHDDLPGTYQYAGYLIRFRINPTMALPQYVYYVTKSESWHEWIFSNSKTGTLTNINAKQYSTFCFPLPPLEIQREIVAEIENYQKVIDGARAVIDNYQPHIPIDPDWPLVALGKACVVNPRKSEVTAISDTTTISFVPMSDIGENAMYFESRDCKRLKDVSTSYTYFRDNDVLIAKVTPCFENGKAGIAKNLCNTIGFGSSEFYVLRPAKKILPEWIFLCVATPAFRKWATPQMTGTGGLQRVPRSVIENYEIPLPPLKIQQEIVAESEAEQALVNANRELVKRMESKIQAAIGQVWSDDSIKTEDT